MWNGAHLLHVFLLACAGVAMFLYACLYACARMCVGACMCLCVSVCMYVCVYVFVCLCRVCTLSLVPLTPTHKYPCLTLLPDPCTLLYRSKLISDIKDIGGFGERMQKFLDATDRGMVCLSSAGLMQTLKRFQHHDQYANVSFHGCMWAYVHLTT